MDSSSAVETCYRNYFTFSGRARRAEFWWFTLFCLKGFALLVIVDGFITTKLFGTPLAVPGFFLATVIPYVAVTVRRFHDRNASGWWALLLLFPIVGHVPMLILCAIPGKRGANRFGSDPVKGSMVV